MPKEYINPTGVPAHPYFTRVLSITSPSKLVYIAGQVPSDEHYKPVHVGDIRAQFIAVEFSAIALASRDRSTSWLMIVCRDGPSKTLTRPRPTTISRMTHVVR